MFNNAQKTNHRRYSGIQPQYFPRLHYFARILQADIFLIRDDVQFVRKHKYPDGKTGKSFQANSPIKVSNGIFFLTVPIKHNGFSTIKETRLSYDNNWIEAHLKTIQNVYGKSLYFSKIFPDIKNILSMKFETLAELNIMTIFWGILKILGESSLNESKLSAKYVQKKLSGQSTFRLRQIKFGSQSKIINSINNLTANEKIIYLCKEFGANEDYCGGTGAAAYVDKNLFDKNGIKVTVQDWTCKRYGQLFTKNSEFIPNLSIIDLLMNTSVEETKSVIKG